MRTMIECEMDVWRLAEKGIEFICPNRHCPLQIQCSYAARTSYDEGEAK